MTVVVPDIALGRTSISSRALDRVASAVSATALGVDAGRVSVALSDVEGELALAVSAPIRIVSLSRIAADPGLVARAGGTVLERAREAQEQIRSTVASLTGYRIASVTVRLASADVRPEGRVR